LLIHTTEFQGHLFGVIATEEKFRAEPSRKNFFNHPYVVAFKSFRNFNAGTLNSLMKKHNIKEYFMDQDKKTRKPTGTGFFAFSTAEDGKKILLAGPEGFQISVSYAHEYHHYFLSQRLSQRG